MTVTVSKACGSEMPTHENGKEAERASSGARRAVAVGVDSIEAVAGTQLPEFGVTRWINSTKWNEKIGILTATNELVQIGSRNVQHLAQRKSDRYKLRCCIKIGGPICIQGKLSSTSK